VDTAVHLGALNVETAAQRINETNWRQPTSLMPSPRPGTRQRSRDSLARAGPSGEGATEGPEYMDVEELVGGGCGLSESGSSLSDSDSEVEEHEKMQRSEATKMPVPLGRIYCHLHGLVRDPDWWQPYVV
jgi:hypothetical protein